MLLDIIHLPLETESGIKIVELLLSETKQIKSNQFVFTVCEEIETWHTEAGSLNFCLNYYTGLYFKGELIESEKYLEFEFLF